MRAPICVAVTRPWEDPSLWPSFRGCRKRDIIAAIHEGGHATECRLHDTAHGAAVLTATEAYIDVTEPPWGEPGCPEALRSENIEICLGGPVAAARALCGPARRWISHHELVPHMAVTGWYGDGHEDLEDAWKRTLALSRSEFDARALFQYLELKVQMEFALRTDWWFGVLHVARALLTFGRLEAERIDCILDWALGGQTPAATTARLIAEVTRGLRTTAPLAPPHPITCVVNSMR